MEKTRRTALLAFFSGFFMFIAVVLPDLISCGGVLMFSADYLQQSIPFTYRIFDILRSGTLGFDMSAGLGSDTLTSFAFYGLFSPFSFLYLPFPRDILIYAMPYVTAVKYGAGSLFAYMWIKRYVKSPHFAVIGGMVYMFSSFTAYNVIFHFTDAIALFPLLLLSIDALCEDGRRGVFALAAALLALTNYYFFFGQAVFLVIYFLCGYARRDIKKMLKKLLPALAEAVIGTLMACFVLLPVAYALLSSEKATGLMSAGDMLFYKDIYKYLHILQSFFSVPDGFALVTVFPEKDTVYPFGMLGASVAAYLPFFSAAGVISAFFIKGKLTREKLIFAVCAVFALVPVLNQSFSAFNSALYARWYYMPMLVGAMVSVKLLDEGESFRPGILTCAGALTVLALCRAFQDEKTFMRSSTSRAVFNPWLGILDIAVAAVSLIVLVIVVKSKRDKEFVPKLYILSYICVYLCFGIMSFYTLTSFDVQDKSSVAQMYEFGEERPDYISESDRVTVPAQAVNSQMIWGFESPSHFNSLHDPGFARFLDKSDMRYSNGLFADISIKYKELADLVSVRYFMSYGSLKSTNEELETRGNFGGYIVCGNPDYIPLGFTYDLMLSEEDFSGIEEKQEKHKAYMKYLVVEDTGALSDIEGLEAAGYSPVTESEYKALIERHRAECAHDTVISPGGLTSQITLAKENIVFYSVSYNDGWRAWIDGVPAQLFRVQNGLIGVRAPAGTHRIVLGYETPLASAGRTVSLCGAALYALYLSIPYIKKKLCSGERKK